MSTYIDTLDWIQTWFSNQCNESWEHSYGIRINTLDNPGWSVTIDLHGTKLENKLMEEIAIERSDDDWVFCSVKNKEFKAAGGPRQLKEILEIFKAWVGNSRRLD